MASDVLISQRYIRRLIMNSYFSYCGSIVFFTLLSSFSLAEEVAFPDNADVAKTFESNLISGLKGQKVMVLKASPDASFQKLLLTAEIGGKQSVVLTAPLALPLIKNSYSPASYDGFNVGEFDGGKGVVRLVDTQGEMREINYKPAVEGKYLYLKTVEEDNAQYRFNLRFKYNSEKKKIVLEDLFVVSNVGSCDRSVLNVYAIKSSALIGVALEDFNGLDAFGYLNKLRVDSGSDAVDREKLMSVDVGENFDQALRAYKKNDLSKFKELMGYFIVSSDEGAVCAPENYVVGKYYYPENIGWSNDLGFLLEQSGYFPEAIELLSYIVSKNPSRTVAYLNLADAYWGDGKKDLAIENYKKYNSLMSQAGKAGKIPKRVLERSQS